MAQLRISRIKVKNFKSLVDFTIDLPKFSCLVGLNGCGKSTILQFIDFLSQLVRGRIEDWFEARKWEPEELLPSFLDDAQLVSKTTPIDFEIQFATLEGKNIGYWKCDFDTKILQCTKEECSVNGFKIQVQDQQLIRNYILSEDGQAILKHNQETLSQIEFNYSGSVLSVIHSRLLPKPIKDFKEWILDTQSLELLSPEAIRSRTRESGGELGLNGQYTSSFIAEMNSDKKTELRKLVSKVYPQLDDVVSEIIGYGWKQLSVVERRTNLFKKVIQRRLNFEDDNTYLKNIFVSTKARHINDGMLRVIAIFAELISRDSFMVLDEIENGINPEIIEYLVDHLVAANRQIMVTTHSPMILNYLDDDVALESVIYIYKDDFGCTHSIPLFSIPSVKKKLEIMGPGEAYVDTILSRLTEEILTMSDTSKNQIAGTST